MINLFQSICIAKKEQSVKKTIIKATGPLVKIAKPKNIQGVIQIVFFSLTNLLQKESKLMPIVPHNKESLTAVLLQIKTKGDKANPKAAIKEI